MKAHCKIPNLKTMHITVEEHSETGTHNALIGEHMAFIHKIFNQGLFLNIFKRE